MSDRLLGSVTAQLSLAVDLVDGFTGRAPVGNPAPGIEGLDVDPMHNPSGYHVFLDLEPGTVTLHVDGGTHYLDETVTDVEIPDPATVDASVPSTLPVETVELAPAPPYRFPAGATVIRGIVRNPGGDPLPGATVNVENRRQEMSTRTDANGEYVLFFDPVTRDDVATADGRTVVEVDGDPPRLVARHPVHGQAASRLAKAGDSVVEEGTLTVADIDYA
jgi:hypothetical protein